MKKVSEYDVSVIIPAHDCGKFLDDTLKKILSIKSIKIQVVIVNDGSSDNTDDICRKYSDKKCISYRSLKENIGVSGARNIGIDMAEAKYITFLDADDDFDINMYASLYARALENDADVVICNYYEIDNGKKIKSKYEYKDGVMSRDECIRMFLKDSIGPTVWDVLVSRKIIKGLYFNEKMKVAEDNIFVIQMLMRTKRNYITNDRLYYYVQNSTSAMHRLSRELNITNIKRFLSSNERNELSREYPEEYTFWELQLTVHSVHAIANSSNRRNRKEAKKMLSEMSIENIRKITRDATFPMSVRLEFVMILLFGARFYLFVFPLLRRIKKIVRST